MCGIIGYLDTSSNVVELEKGLQLMKHRGPDNRGFETHSFDDYHVGLGHLRLSIIDLSPASNQPFIDSSSRYSIVFNGEIYNFKKLRMMISGIEMKTSGDTEVLVELYRQFGTEMVKMLEGMFAFAIYDAVEHTIFIARDQLGIKPLYIYNHEGRFIFASEIKGVKAFSAVNSKIDESCISEFLLNGFLYEPDTGYQFISKLPPAHIGLVSVKEGDLNLHTERYWSVDEYDINTQKRTSLQSLIKSEVDAHMVSDAKMGLFFSGGVDSSLIMCLAEEELQPMIVRPAKSEVKAAGLVNDYDYAKRIAEIRKVQLSEVQLGDRGTSILDEIRWIAEHVEEPIADYTFLASYNVSKAAHEDQFKVMQSGMGADEIFGGYDRYLLLKYSKLLQFFRLPLAIFGKRIKSLAKKVDRFGSFFKEPSFGMRYTNLVGYFNRTEVQDLLRADLRSGITKFESKIDSILERCNFSSPLKKGMYLDSLGFLSHNFLVADKSSMLASIEVRVPLATKNLFAKAIHSNESMLIKGGTTKYILKKILLRFLPNDIVNRKKQGFNPPLDTRINDLGATEIKKFLNDTPIYQILNKPNAEQIIDAHFDKRDNYTYKIYSLLFFAAWYDINKSK